MGQQPTLSKEFLKIYDFEKKKYIFGSTSKWIHGEMAVFGSTVYKIFALKMPKVAYSAPFAARSVRN